MTSIVIEFVSRVLFSLLWMQAELLAFLRPAQLVVGRLLTKNRCHALFTIRFPTSSPLDIPRSSQTEGNSLTILKVLAGISRQNRNYHVVKAVRSSDGRTGRFEALYLTPLFKWTDVVELTILPTTNGVVAECRSASASIVPASVPAAPFWALFLWWVPFDDHYQNYAHLREVRHFLSAQGFEVEENILVRGNCLMETFGEKVGKDHGFVDFHNANASMRSQ